MNRASYMRTEGKAKLVQERLHEKGFICISDEWMRWAKRYLNKIERRKIKNIYVDVEI